MAKVTDFFRQKQKRDQTPSRQPGVSNPLKPKRKTIRELEKVFEPPKRRKK